MLRVHPLAQNFTSHGRGPQKWDTNGFKPKRTHGLQKQISIYVSVSDWQVMRSAAAKRGISITALCREMMEPGMVDLLSPVADLMPPPECRPVKTAAQKRSGRPAEVDAFDGEERWTIVPEADEPDHGPFTIPFRGEVF